MKQETGQIKEGRWVHDKYIDPRGDEESFNLGYGTPNRKSLSQSRRYSKSKQGGGRSMYKTAGKHNSLVNLTDSDANQSNY